LQAILKINFYLFCFLIVNVSFKARFGIEKSWKK